MQSNDLQQLRNTKNTYIWFLSIWQKVAKSFSEQPITQHWRKSESAFLSSNSVHFFNWVSAVKIQVINIWMPLFASGENNKPDSSAKDDWLRATRSIKAAGLLMATQTSSMALVNSRPQKRIVIGWFSRGGRANVKVASASNKIRAIQHLKIEIVIVKSNEFKIELYNE